MNLPMRNPTVDVLHSSLQHCAEDTAGNDSNEVRDDAHDDDQQQLPMSRTVTDEIGEPAKLVSQGTDGLATACKTPLHEHNVHEGCLRSAHNG